MKHFHVFISIGLLFLSLLVQLQGRFNHPRHVYVSNGCSGYKKIKVRFEDMNNRQLCDPVTIQNPDSADVILPPDLQETNIISVVYEIKAGGNEVRLGWFRAYNPSKAADYSTEENGEICYKYAVIDNGSIFFLRNNQYNLWGRLEN